MAVDGCWGPMCEFTGTRLVSNANPGRCTKTPGYISNAEINEIIKAEGAILFHDAESNSDVLLYQGASCLAQLRRLQKLLQYGVLTNVNRLR